MKTPQATIAYVLFFILAIVWFLTKPAHRAAALTLLVGMLYLPEATGYTPVPALPAIDKKTFPTFLVLLLNALLAKRLFAKVRVGKVYAVLIATMLLSNIPRAFGNQDPILRDGVILHGLLPHSSITFMLNDVLVYLTMLYVGMAIAQRRDWLIAFLKTWIAFVTVYCVFVLWEARFSPQLHTKLYGYFQHSWDQMTRDGGYRPIVWMTHALAVGLLISVTSILLFGLGGQKIKVFGISTRLLTWFTVACLAAAKCTAAIIYFMASAATMIMKSTKLQARIAAVCALLVFTMPALRATQLFPWEYAIELAEQYVNKDRASSLRYRFENEEVILQNTLDRPWFGMGGNSRAFSFGSDGRGYVVDSFWIIIFMERGFVGYFGVFGLLSWPLLNVPKALKRAANVRDQKLLGALALAASMASIDLMVNGLFNTLPFLLSGLVWGAATSAWLKTPENQPSFSGRPPLPSGHSQVPGMYPALPR